MRSPTSPTRSAFTGSSTPTLYSRPFRYIVSCLCLMSCICFANLEQYTRLLMLPNSASTSTMSERARAPSSRLSTELLLAISHTFTFIHLVGATVRIIPHRNRLRQPGVCIPLFFYPSPSCPSCHCSLTRAQICLVIPVSRADHFFTVQTS